MKISPARTAAFDVLLRVFRDGGFSSILLPAAEADLSEKDRALCHELVLGVLRTRLLLDSSIDEFSGGKPVDLEVRIAAYLGLYQLNFLQKIPKYSAVNESVALVQRAKKSSAKGFVNALLRRAKLSGAAGESDVIGRLALETSHPRWVVEKWVADKGIDEASALLRANNLRPRAAFRLTAKGMRDGALPKRDWEPSGFVPGCYLAGAITPEMRKMAERGLIYFQDEGSQLVGSLLKLSDGEKFLDVSAAPGSKTTMVATAAPSSSTIVAGDIYQSRVRVLQRNCEAQGLEHVSIVRYDAESVLPFADEEFDKVLVDAPCSGTGTIRNNPEIRYFLKPEDFAELHGKQLAILRNASKAVRKGGELVYSTCSMEPEENEQVVSAFLTSNDEFSVRRPDVASELVIGGGFVRTSPARHDMDGFFAAVLLKRG